MNAHIVNQNHNDNTADSSVQDVEIASILARATPGHRIELETRGHTLAVVIGEVTVNQYTRESGVPSFCTERHLPQYFVDGKPVTRDDFVVISDMLRS